jgi:hypothetical protein
MADTTQITVRHVDRRLKQFLDQSAKKSGKTLNEEVLQRLSSTCDIDIDAEPSWMKFVGSIEEGGFDEEAFDYFERIDPDMWK